MPLRPISPAVLPRRTTTGMQLMTFSLTETSLSNLGVLSILHQIGTLPRDGRAMGNSHMLSLQAMMLESSITGMLTPNTLPPKITVVIGLHALLQRMAFQIKSTKASLPMPKLIRSGAPLSITTPSLLTSYLVYMAGHALSLHRPILEARLTHRRQLVSNLPWLQEVLYGPLPPHLSIILRPLGCPAHHACGHTYLTVRQ